MMPFAATPSKLSSPMSPIARSRIGVLAPGIQPFASVHMSYERRQARSHAMAVPTTANMTHGIEVCVCLCVCDSVLEKASESARMHY